MLVILSNFIFIKYCFTSVICTTLLTLLTSSIYLLASEYLFSLGHMIIQYILTAKALQVN